MDQDLKGWTRWRVDLHERYYDSRVSKLWTCFFVNTSEEKEAYMEAWDAWNR